MLVRKRHRTSSKVEPFPKTNTIATVSTAIKRAFLELFLKPFNRESPRRIELILNFNYHNVKLQNYERPS